MKKSNALINVLFMMGMVVLSVVVVGLLFGG